MPTEHEADIAGRRLILGNDVLTSGAAADVCARALFRPVLPMSTCWYSRGLWRWRALPYKRCPQAQNAMPPVEIYTTRYCLFCYAAKALLKRKGVNYSEIDVGRDWERREEMIQRANGSMTVPQIFIGTVHVGGSDELHALERAGKLDPLLAGDEASA